MANAKSRGAREVDKRGAVTVADLAADVDLSDPASLPADVAVADIDANGVFWGVVSKPAAGLAPDDVLVHDKIDLPAGRYKWDGQRFAPLPQAAQPKVPNAPSLEVAFDALLSTLATGGTKLPTECRQWQAHFKTTIDNKR